MIFGCYNDLLRKLQMQENFTEETKGATSTGMDKENVTEAPVDQIKAEVAQNRRQKYPKGEALILIGNQTSTSPAAT
jgi:hypothetical protein